MLVEKATQLTMEVNKLKETMFNNYGTELFKSMDGESLNYILQSFKICDLAMEIVEEEANAIQEINEKLDKLLAMKDRA